MKMNLLDVKKISVRETQWDQEGGIEPSMFSVTCQQTTFLDLKSQPFAISIAMVTCYEIGVLL